MSEWFPISCTDFLGNIPFQQSRWLIFFSLDASYVRFSLSFPKSMLVLEVLYFLSLHSRQFRHIALFFFYIFFFHSVFMHIKRSNYVWKRLLWNLHLHSNVAYKMTESMLCIRWEIIMISMSFLMRTELTARIHLHGHIWVVIWCHTIQSNYKNIHKIIPMPYWNAVRNAIISAKTVDFAHTHSCIRTKLHIETITIHLMTNGNSIVESCNVQHICNF